jgi:hypothetical protein
LVRFNVTKGELKPVPVHLTITVDKLHETHVGSQAPEGVITLISCPRGGERNARIEFYNTGSELTRDADASVSRARVDVNDWDRHG